MNQLIKRHAVICLLITSSICAHAQWGWGNGIMGEGPTVRKTINLEDINGFSLGVPANVYLKKGKQKIEIKGQKNIIDNIERDVSRGIWDIEFDKNVKNMKDLEIYITIPSFKKLGIAGSGSIIGEAAFNNLSNVAVSIAGSGDIEVEGKADNLDVTIAGSGDVNLKDLKVSSCEVSIAGSGDCEIHVASDLKVSIAGSGDVKYKGNPDKVKSSIAGSGDVRSF